MLEHVEKSLEEAEDALSRLRKNKAMLRQIAEVGKILSQSLKNGGRVYSCGNGGSMCDAMHFAEELSGRYRDNRLPLAAMSISDPSHLSCVANDFGYEEVFSRFLEAFAGKADVLLAISTSGKSLNIIKAAEMAKKKGAKVIALLGREGSSLEKIADYSIITPAGQYADRVQELHIKVIHILIELCERELFPENYKN
ncbi:MAG: SIS domain-containing protein [Oligoflexales bacterium]|nr:SIS domain-containing protein [Oligoflexales bacterium]